MTASLMRRAVTLTANPHANHAPKIDKMAVLASADPYVQLKALLNGGAQGMITVPPALRSELAAADDVALKSYDLRSWWFIAVNTHRAPLGQKAVRQALNLTLDRDELRRLTIGVEPDDPNPPVGLVSGPFVQSSPYYNRKVKVTPHADSEAARALMASVAEERDEQWWVNGAPIRLRVGMKASLDREAKDLLSQVENQLRRGGFDAEVIEISDDEWSRRATSGTMDEYDLLIGKWSFGVVEDVNTLFHTRGKDGRGRQNIFNYSDTEADRMMRAFEAARTDTEAQDAYHDLHAHLAEELPYLFLWKLDTKSAWRTEVRNNTIAPYYYFTDFTDWKLVEAP